jgi:hypothetical protein
MRDPEDQRSGRLSGFELVGQVREIISRISCCLCMEFNRLGYDMGLPSIVQWSGF